MATKKMARCMNLPLVRTGSVNRNTALVIVGLAGCASLLQLIRRRRKRPNSPAVARRSRPQAMQAADTMRDWGNDSPVMELREVKGNEVLLLDETLPLTPKQLWKLVYDLNFIQQFYLKKGNREIGIGSWQKTGEKKFTKSAHYITPVKKNVFGPSEAYTEEEYTCERRGDTGFAVKVCAYNRKVPYGGSFHVEVHWTASRVSQSQTRLQVVGGFVPEKRMIGVAGIIKNATNEGLRDTYEMFKEHLWETIRSGAVPRHASQAGAARTVSSAAKEAAEDLINNGIFISWGQLTTAFLLIFCAFMVARLAVARGESRAVVVQQQWEPRLLGWKGNASTHYMVPNRSEISLFQGSPAQFANGS